MSRPTCLERTELPEKTFLIKRLVVRFEKMIVEEAIRFFAEAGFAGQTRELARRLDVTQPLLFQYFPTKDDLIERVRVWDGRAWQ